jgi:hypothetical protein
MIGYAVDSWDSCKWLYQHPPAKMLIEWKKNAEAGRESTSNRQNKPSPVLAREG